MFLTSLELSKSYKHQLQDLDKDMKETEAAFSVSVTLANIQSSEGMRDVDVLNLSVPAERDRRAECAEPSSAREVKCRGEQEEVG